MPVLKEMMIEELLAQAAYKPVHKDIIVVVKDQLDYVKKCIDSIFLTTRDFTLYVWDNGSGEETAEYLRSLEDEQVVLVRSDENDGFIIPNNRLAAVGGSQYIVLLNSDTEVRGGWDEALIGWLQQNPATGVVGYEGGLMNAQGMGVGTHRGAEVDYVTGWCLALSRETYDRLGLFDENNLEFAYCEDADLCLRAKEAGLGVYAINLDLVVHHANITARAVARERNLKPEFIANHEHVRNRWERYLAESRVLLRYPDVEKAAGSVEEVAEEFFKNSPEVAARI